MTEDHFYVGYINKTLEGELMKYQKKILWITSKFKKRLYSMQTMWRYDCAH